MVLADMICTPLIVRGVFDERLQRLSSERFKIYSTEAPIIA